MAEQFDAPQFPFQAEDVPFHDNDHNEEERAHESCHQRTPQKSLLVSVGCSDLTPVHEKAADQQYRSGEQTDFLTEIGPRVAP